jgi:hypothetical protein
MIHYVVPARFDYTVREYLGYRGRNFADHFRIVDPETLQGRDSFERGTYVLVAFNELSQGMLRLLEELHARLSEAAGVRFLNHPTRTLRRFELLNELRRLNLNDFRAVRATADLSGLRYPVFLRSERFHSGTLSPLLRSVGDVERAIGRAVIQGHTIGDLLLVEFCDTADADGSYRKYAAFIVGDRIIPRHLFYGHAWMLKAEPAEFSRSIVLEERDYVFGNPHKRELAEIFAIAGIEYGRIDYGLKNGRIQTWEINLHATIGGPLDADEIPPFDGKRLYAPSRVPEELKPIRLESKDCFYRRFEEAWRAVDTGSGDPYQVVVALDNKFRSDAPSSRRVPRWLRIVRSVLRPLKPHVEPLLRPVLPLLGRLARRGLIR